MRTVSFSVALCVTLSFVACKTPLERERERAAAQKASEGEAAPPAAAEAPAKAAITDAMLAVFKPALPKEFPHADGELSEERIALGRMLYFDKRLSKNHDISCNSCHLLDQFGVDGKKVSPGHKGQEGARNSPSVYNAAGHFVQFWDGRSPDVEDQATGPVMNPVEMAMPDEKHVAATLASMQEYVDAFAKAFPGEKEPVSLKNAGRAMGAFERRLVTPAPWDDFLEGKKSALTEEQKAGFLAFMNNGCTACHMGTLLGGTSYQKLGAVKPWPNQEDQGRYEVTKSDTDKMLFKVPSLRNVAETGPYFHDGSVASLSEAVTMMAQHQLGREVTDADVKSIVAFLGALTGKIPAEYIKEPALPASTPKTPKPDPT